MFLFGRKRKKAIKQVEALLNESRAHFQQGFFDAGLDAAMQAVEHALRHIPNKHLLYPESIFLAADGYLQIGLYDEAYTLFQRGLKNVADNHGGTHPLYIQGIYGLASMYRAIGDQNNEDIALRGIVRIQLEKHGEDHPDYAGALYAVSDLYRRAGWIDLAKHGYQTVMSIYEKLGQRDYLGKLTDCWFGMGGCLFQEGQYEEAAIHFEKAVEGIRQISGDTDGSIGEALQNLGMIQAYTNKPQKALTYFEEAEQVYDQQIRHLFSQNSSEAIRMMLSQMQKSVFRFASLILQYFPDDAIMAKKLFELLGKRKSLGLDRALQQEEDWTNSDKPQVQQQVQEFRQLKARIAEKALAGPDYDQTLEDHHSQMMQWEFSAQKIEKNLLNHSDKNEPEHIFRNFAVERLTERMAEHTILVEFFQFQNMDFRPAVDRNEKRETKLHYLAMICNQTGEVSCMDLGESEKIDQAIRRFRRNITGQNEEEAEEKRSLYFGEDVEFPAKDSGMNLYEWIIQPLERYLQGAQFVWIAPDSNIGRVPFEAIPLPNGGLMMDRYQMGYIGTARDLLRPNKSAGSAKSPIVIADPDFDYSANQGKAGSGESFSNSDNAEQLRTRSIRFSPLPGTHQEGRAIAKLLGVRPFLQKEAVESVLHSAHSPLILHVATHGFFLANPESEKGRLNNTAALQALRSGLVLAGVNTWLKEEAMPAEAMDGILNCEDVAKLQLTSTEMVVLSACETGLGDSLAGEGIFGLARAFTLAGAKCRIISLWEVPDEITKELMIAFYQLLLSGKGRAESLHHAKLQIRDEHPEPKYWAGFICQGEMGPIPGLETA